MDRRSFIKNAGVGAGLGLKLQRDFTSSTSLSGKVIDLDNNPVAGADVYIYYFDNNIFNISLVSQVSTNESGNWSEDINIPENTGDYSGTDPRPVVAIVAKKDGWTDTKAIKAISSLESNHTLLLDKYIIANISVGGPPENRKLTADNPHYGTVSIVRKFDRQKPSSKESIRVHLFNSMDVLGVSPGRQSNKVRYKSISLTTSLSEEIQISRMSNDQSDETTNSLSRRGIIPHTKESIPNMDEIFSPHTDPNLSGPMTPVFSHTYLLNLYKSRKEVKSNEINEALFEIALAAAQNFIPVLGTVGQGIQYLSATNSILKAMVDKTGEEVTVEKKNRVDLDILPDNRENNKETTEFRNKMDSFSFGYNRVGRVENPAEAAYYTVDINWEESNADQTPLVFTGGLQRNDNRALDGPDGLLFPRGDPSEGITQLSDTSPAFVEYTDRIQRGPPELPGSKDSQQKPTDSSESTESQGTNSDSVASSFYDDFSDGNIKQDPIWFTTTDDANTFNTDINIGVVDLTEPIDTKALEYDINWGIARATTGKKLRFDAPWTLDTKLRFPKKVQPCRYTIRFGKGTGGLFGADPSVIYLNVKEQGSNANRRSSIGVSGKLINDGQSIDKILRADTWYRLRARHQGDGTYSVSWWPASDSRDNAATAVARGEVPETTPENELPLRMTGSREKGSTRIQTAYINYRTDAASGNK